MSNINHKIITKATSDGDTVYYLQSEHNGHTVERFVGVVADIDADALDIYQQEHEAELLPEHHTKPIKKGKRK